MTEITMTLHSSTGPVEVQATEPVPGLRVYRLPGEHPEPWHLAHHQGHILALAATEGTATATARAVADMTDWTRNTMTCANALFSSGSDLAARIQQAGGHTRPTT
ncbi:hypothetical protein [Streptomyces sp. ST2-7A]|uniref:hypothetical protein n=1 Tax=Streptomyces sp. ST2-7A TaxID=2907214 RepID=UPI001F332E50|nr:hypothetical protein [Streptomyces sp. ST2-7A]MCE7083472.1 hypothetical protein [Streptomyces sp. ST2-7A]